MIYLLSCNETPHCEEINKIICDAAQDNRRLSPSQWIIITNEDSTSWVRRLEETLKQAEHRLILVPITGIVQGWLHDDTWTWLNSHIQTGQPLATIPPTR